MNYKYKQINNNNWRLVKYRDNSVHIYDLRLFIYDSDIIYACRAESINSFIIYSIR